MVWREFMQWRQHVGIVMGLVYKSLYPHLDLGFTNLGNLTSFKEHDAGLMERVCLLFCPRNVKITIRNSNFLYEWIAFLWVCYRHRRSVLHHEPKTITVLLLTSIITAFVFLMEWKFNTEVWRSCLIPENISWTHSPGFQLTTCILFPWGIGEVRILRPYL